MRAFRLAIVLITGVLLAQHCRADAQAQEAEVATSKACDEVHTLQKGLNRCEYVKDHCGGDSIIPYFQFFYCHAQPAGIAAEVLFQGACGFLLVLIFRMLGSTAEDFFSPIMTQMSQDLGLPPRFAGVTLLAMGNGAPDVITSMNFIRAGAFEVALSGLLGSGMFIGAIVAGSVIIAAGGVKARGALLRDVSCYMVSVAVVTGTFWTGRMTWPLAVLLLVMYVLFVATVLAADVTHIWRSKMRGEVPHAKPAERQPLLAGNIAQAPEADLPDAEACVDSAHSIELTEGQLSTLGSDNVERVSWSQGNSGGRDSTWSADGTHLTYNEKVHMSGQTYRQMALAEMAHSTTFFGDPAMERARRAAIAEAPANGPSTSHLQTHQHSPEVSHHEPDSDLPLRAGYQPPQPRIEEGQPELEEGGPGNGAAEPAGGVAGRAVQDERRARVQQWCSEGHGLGDARRGVAGGPSTDSLAEEPPGPSQASFPGHHRAWLVLAGVWKAIEAAFFVAEYPLLLLRRLTIPLADNDSYDRRWLVASAVGTPLAVLWYCSLLTWLSLAAAVPASALAAAIVFRFTVPGKAPEWACGLPFPVGAAAVAALGFVVSAMWIDTIAGELVALLEYLGVMSGIDPGVLGLTVLAWGNSVGDFSTDTAMARKGLSNMAMTACFACPIFNLLVGLSLGFMRLFAAQGVSSVAVSLKAVNVPSIVLILVNGALLASVGLYHRGWVPGWYGAVPLALYGLCMCISVAVAVG